MKETLNDKELIALGEVTHGTAEVFSYKDRLVRFLVTHLGYKAIAFESDFLAIGYMDDYITGKADSIKYVAGTAIMRSNHLMIEWLRRYNIGKADADKVRIFGLESRNYTNIFNKLIAVIPNLEKADKDVQGKINDFATVAALDSIEFVGLTSADSVTLDAFKKEYKVNYTFYTNPDDVPLKTMIRSNPGLVLLKGSTVVAMWHHNSFPSYTDVKEKYFKN